VFSTDNFNASKATIVTANILVISVTSEKERNNTAEKVTASVAGRLPLYPMEMARN
jgi:hypothetical protein